ncbi:MAG: nitrogen regulation protein NR(II) [Anaerolineae bacterium]
MTGSAHRYRLSLRLYVVFSLLMALSATASGLFLLHLARPFISESPSRQPGKAAVLLFVGAAVAGGMAAVVGLFVGRRFTGRIQGIVEKAEAISPPGREAPQKQVLDELAALDATVGRLTLSMDHFIRDSEILARLPEGMLLLGPDGSLVSFNTTGEALLELPLERFGGKPILSAEGPFPLEKGNDAMARLLDAMRDGSRSTHSGEMMVRTATGRRLLLEVTAQRRDGAPEAAALILLFRDASEKLRIREEIRRADQLAFLGGMAARVAHEIRTPLASIRGLVELLQADLADTDPRRAYIDRILQGLERQDRLVENLLTLRHPEPETWQAVSLPGLFKELLGVLPADPRLTMAMGEPASLPHVWGDPFRLSEVFTNLIRNALESTPENGRVLVRVEPDSGERIRVVVRNTGAGILPELQERVFQPFFTTKPRGTGLGLAIARRIVEAHRGSLRLESDGRSETNFVVELPTGAPVMAGA